MKRIFKFLPFLFLSVSLILNSCSEDEVITNQSENIMKKSNYADYEYNGYSLIGKDIQEHDIEITELNDLINSFNNNNERGEVLELKENTSKYISFKDYNYHILDASVDDSSLQHLGYTSFTKVVKIKTNDEEGLPTSRNMILRVLEKDNIVIKEVVSPISGKIVSWDLQNISISDYETLKPNVYIPNEQDEQNSVEGDTHYCWTSHHACVQFMTGSNSDEDNVVCDWLPCNTVAYAACTVAYISGDIEGATGFHCEHCDVLIGEI